MHNHSSVGAKLKVLIAISSCYDWERNGNNDVLRKTWLPEVAKIPGFEYRFFFGHGQGAESNYVPDAVYLPDTPDDYGHLSYKTRSSLRWAHSFDYDFVFRCFPDTYCRPERLATCGFEKHDYYGDFRGEHCTPDNYPSGGPGYMMSRKAIGPILVAPIIGDEAQGKHVKVWPYAEDLWVGQVLNWNRSMGFKYFDDNRFVNRGTSYPGPLKHNNIISTHLSCPDRYHPDRMVKAHQAWLKSCECLVPVS